MAKEAIGKIKQAEAAAAEALRQAAAKAGQIADDAEREAAAECERILKDARDKRESLIQGARLDAQKECKPLIEQGKDEARKIKNPDREKFELAVKSVTERIVNVHGNSKNEPLHSISL